MFFIAQIGPSYKRATVSLFDFHFDICFRTRLILLLMGLCLAVGYKRAM